MAEFNLEYWQTGALFKNCLWRLGRFVPGC